MSSMFDKKAEKSIPVGCQNDEMQISKVLNEEPYRKLTSVRFNDQKLILTFGEHDFRFPSRKRVLQISKKKYSDVYERIRHIFENEVHTNSYGLKTSKTWQILTIIELSDKWLVFMI